MLVNYYVFMLLQLVSKYCQDADSGLGAPTDMPAGAAKVPTPCPNADNRAPTQLTGSPAQTGTSKDWLFLIAFSICIHPIQYVS